MAELRALSRDRDRLLESQQRIEAQLHAILDAYHPAPAQLFSSIDRDITLASIADYPTPQAAARIGEQRMAAFCRWQSYRGRVDPAILTQRLKDHLLSGAKGTVAGKAHSAQVFAELLGVLNRQLADYDDALELALAKHPDAPIFLSFPGVGPLTAATCSSRSARTATTIRRLGCCWPRPGWHRSPGPAAAPTAWTSATPPTAG
jgi:transposase